MFLGLQICAGAQNDTIHLSGRVFDADNSFVRINFFVVNKRTGKGLFGDHKGQFKLDVSRKDTIVVSSKDYYSSKIVVRDSCRGSRSCDMIIFLRRKEIELRPVEIVPVREHTQIVKDIKDLEEPKNIERVTADAISSPISALYQAFSKLEKEKHKARLLEAEDRKREVLTELLTKYLKSDAIDLAPDQFEDFLNVAQFDVEYLASLSDYHLITYVQYKVESYHRFNEFYNVFRRLQHNDYMLMLREAKGEKMGITTDLFKQFIDKGIYEVVNQDPDFMFEFINYSNLNIAELIQMSDYGLIATVMRKYGQFRSIYGILRKR